MSVLFVFIDGVGVGQASDENPLFSDKLRSFSTFTKSKGLSNLCKEILENNILYKAIDANLDVEGLQQSGTGQTSLFTGINASRVIGKHFGPYPHSKIKTYLKKESLFHRAIEAGKKPHFINAYPDIFFDKSEKKDRWSCTTLMTKSAGIPLNREEDVINEKAVTAEIIQSAWRDMLKLDVPQIEPEEASIRIIKALEVFDLVLYEYYLTDKAGHEQSFEMANRVLSILDRFLIGIIEHLNPNDTLVITSDHGNIEDLSVKTHTRNPVPLMVMGNTKPFFEAKTILDVTPAILNVLKD